MENEIIISNFVKLADGTYKVFFTSNFDLTELRFETSLNNVDWNTPVLIEGTTSPKILAIPISQDFYIRLFDTSQEVAPRIHTSVFTNVFN